ncbi:hypothetical protein Bpfe_014412 [Biomphalaria pfeifferi]|uniref:Uncharacterized protein n=1 Tax=Biomphalaria pfeifferi TaxID=112525 RepID=A0AAD8BKK8_BIOPF|nr:hypothetical protein Bpfe_014412 [Biomphalaria pfeifferi]
MFVCSRDTGAAPLTEISDTRAMLLGGKARRENLCKITRVSESARVKEEHSEEEKKMGQMGRTVSARLRSSQQGASLAKGLKCESVHGDVSEFGLSICIYLGHN